MDSLTCQEITLSLMTRESAQKIFPLFQQDMAELVRWFAFDPGYCLENDFQTIDADRQTSCNRTFIVFYKGEPCGRVGLYDYNEQEKTIYMYYWVSSQYRRKHIASRSLSLAADYAKKMEIAVKWLCFDVDMENTASLEMLRKIPGIREGSTGTKHMIWSLELSADTLQKQIADKD